VSLPCGSVRQLEDAGHRVAVDRGGLCGDWWPRLLGGASVLDSPDGLGPLIMLVLSISAVAVGVMGALTPSTPPMNRRAGFGGTERRVCAFSP